MKLKDPAHSLYTSSSSATLPAADVGLVISLSSSVPVCLGASSAGDLRAHMGLGASLQMTPAALTLPGLLLPLVCHMPLLTAGTCGLIVACGAGLGCREGLTKTALACTPLLLLLGDPLLQAECCATDKRSIVL
jgi:hypothetical protein